jgi:hypothetical protein
MNARTHSIGVVVVALVARRFLALTEEQVSELVRYLAGFRSRGSEAAARIGG